MNKEDLDINVKKEMTEDLTQILNGITEDVKKMKDDMETLSDTIIDDKDNDDFLKLVRKMDYKGFDDKEEAEEVKKTSNNPKKRLKKWVYVALIILVVGIIFGTYKIINNKNIAKKKEEETKIIENIKSHYNKYVKVDSDTELYEKENDNYKKIGTIYKDVQLELSDTNITINTKYFKIKDMDYYVKALDVSKIDELKESDTRYKNYLPFNINIVTKDNFTIYLDDDKLITLNKEMEFPVIINNYNDKYYVEYNNKLVNISKDDVSKTIEKNNTDKKNQSKITTFAYHRVHDTDEKCTDPYICIKKESFDKQMKYLSENKYFTLNLNELYMYLKGSLQVEKGVVITFDDGYLFKSADEVLDKYKLNGTMFVISSDFSDYSVFKNLKAIDVQSHTHNMHRNYVCAGGNQGGAILCAGKDRIIADLKKSVDVLGVEPIAIAYPFYDYNDTAISALKEAGFKMAFIGAAGVNGKSTPKVTNLYKIPRMTIWEDYLTSFNKWKSYL